MRMLARERYAGSWYCYCDVCFILLMLWAAEDLYRSCTELRQHREVVSAYKHAFLLLMFPDRCEALP